MEEETSRSLHKMAEEMPNLLQAPLGKAQQVPLSPAAPAEAGQVSLPARGQVALDPGSSRRAARVPPPREGN